MSSSEEFRLALERRRALLRARDLEVAQAKELRATVAITVLESKDAVRRAQELLDKFKNFRRRWEPLSAEIVR